jgi:cation diffusion facilitator family transporter
MNDKTTHQGEHALGASQGHVAGHDVFDTSDQARYRASRRVTRTSILVNVGLAAAQVIMGIVGRSQALVADGVHTLSDILTDLMVLFALKHGAKEADEDHPYGHGRIETAVTVFLGLALIGVAVGIALNAGLRLADTAKVPGPSPLTMAVALLTIVSKEGLYRYTLHIAKRVRSNLLRANAWHHRSDAISSVIVLVGIGGTLAGIPHLDGIAAVGVAMMIAKIGWELGWNAVKELVDTALDAEEVEHIKQTILGVDGVRSLHLLRTRRTGGQALVDVHILVDGTISVSEGHQISESVRHRLIREVDSVTDVLVHIDPEDDETAAPSAGLPLRHQLMDTLRARFSHIDAASRIENITLHYLEGKIDVELLLPLAVARESQDPEGVVASFQEAVKDDPRIGDLHVYFH